MLTFAEEILLLLLDDEKGVLKTLPRVSIETALAAAALMELTFARRVDAGPDKLYVVDTAPLNNGDELSNSVLALLAKEPGEKPLAYWLNSIVDNIPDLEERGLNSLVKKQILRRENKRILWVFEKRRYPLNDGQELLEVKARLRQIIKSGELPEESDAVLISLIRACRLFKEIFPPDELTEYIPRIDKIAKLDFVGQALSKALRDIEKTVCTMSEAIYQYT